MFRLCGARLGQDDGGQDGVEGCLQGLRLCVEFLHGGFCALCQYGVCRCLGLCERGASCLGVAAHAAAEVHVVNLREHCAHGVAGVVQGEVPSRLLYRQGVAVANVGREHLCQCGIAESVQVVALEEFGLALAGIGKRRVGVDVGGSQTCRDVLQ